MSPENQLPPYPEATLEQLLKIYPQKKAAVDELLAETERLNIPPHPRSLQASLIGLKTCTHHIAERLSRRHPEPQSLLQAVCQACNLDAAAAQAAIDNIPTIQAEIAQWQQQAST